MQRPSPHPASAPWALFLDFDGTLVEIAERPEAVAVDPALPGILARLEERLGGALAIVSGRPIAFLDQRLAPLRSDAAGLHGIERRFAGLYAPCRPDEHPALRDAVARIGAAIAAHPGLLVEDKGCSAAIHWRLAPQAADVALGAARDAAAALGPTYRIQLGKAVAEILPAAASKGGVIADFLTAAPYRGRRPVFVGDDLTDEHGFETVNAAGGVSIRVGAGETIARARIENPAALRRLLAAWAADAVPAILAGA